MRLSAENFDKNKHSRRFGTSEPYDIRPEKRWPVERRSTLCATVTDVLKFRLV